MAKSLYKKSKAARLKQEKRLKDMKRRNREFPFTVTIRQACGCCESILRFRSEAAFLDKWRNMPLTCSGSIEDDAGRTHTSLDTFYGYVEGDKNGRSLDYLLEQLTKKY